MARNSAATEKSESESEGGQKFFPSAPSFLFARLFGLRPEKFDERRRDILKKRRSRPCPTRPVRGRQKRPP